MKQKITLFSSLQYKTIWTNLIEVTTAEEREAMCLSLMKGRVSNYKFESEGKRGKDNFHMKWKSIVETGKLTTGKRYRKVEM